MDMIDDTTGSEAFAYATTPAWHRKGRQTHAGQDLEKWALDAGLAHEVHRTHVEFTLPGMKQTTLWSDRQVLYRSDTQAPLAIVGSDYKVVQPSRIIAFFKRLIESNKFEIDCAGALDGGRRIWMLAKVSDGSCVVGADRVRPYVLCATSYDGSMSTVAKFTEIRVVCNNTITAAAGRAGEGQSEVDNVGIVNCVRIPHSDDFDPDRVRMDLSIALDAHDRFMIEMRRLATVKVDAKFCTEFLRGILPKSVHTEIDDAGNAKRVVKPVEETRPFQQIMRLFEHGVGTDMEGVAGTAWGLLNAVSEHVDHFRGRTDDTRLNSAWFGAGEAIKNAAAKNLIAVCA